MTLKLVSKFLTVRVLEICRSALFNKYFLPFHIEWHEEMMVIDFIMIFLPSSMIEIRCWLHIPITGFVHYIQSYDTKLPKLRLLRL